MDVEEVAAVVVAGPKYQMRIRSKFICLQRLLRFSNSILAVLYASNNAMVEVNVVCAKKRLVELCACN